MEPCVQDGHSIHLILFKQLSHVENPYDIPSTDWFIGILIMAYYPPYIT